MNIQHLPFNNSIANQSLFSAESLQSLREQQEHGSLERAGRSVPHSPPVAFMPGAEFYQFDSSFALVTYMVLGADVYYYESSSFSWKRMPHAKASDLRMATKLIKRIG